MKYIATIESGHGTETFNSSNPMELGELILLLMESFQILTHNDNDNPDDSLRHVLFTRSSRINIYKDNSSQQ